MSNNAEINAETEAKNRAEARTARLLAVIFGGVIVLLIGGMLAFDIYAESLHGTSRNAPADAAER